MVQWDVAMRREYAHGQAFGSWGPFEIIEGRVHYAVDPADSRNHGIVDLGLAPRDKRGLVCFSGDYTLVAPRDRLSHQTVDRCPQSRSSIDLLGAEPGVSG